jgi:hypothetical protein
MHLDKEEIMKALTKALVLSTMCGGSRMSVAGVEGVAVAYGGESAGTPATIFVTLPNGVEVTSSLPTGDVGQAAQAAAAFIGL